ncbi:MAG TPA: MFS transporter, partial [Negativicutes bacterium]
MNGFSGNLLLIVTVLYWFSLYTYVPILAPYAQQLGASYSMIGIIVGSYGLTQLLLRIPVGVISDALGRRKLFVISGVCLSVFSALGMWLFTSSVVALLVFRGLSGVAAAAWVDYTVLYVSYFSGKDMAKAIGYISAANALGQVTGMVAGGYVAQYASVTAPFLLGAAGGGIGIVLSLWIKEKKSHPKQTSMKATVELLQNPNLLRVSGLGIVLQAVVFVTVFGFSPVVAKNLGAGNIELGLLSAVCIVPSIISSALSGTFFSKHFGERSTIAGGFFLLAGSCFMVPFIHELPLLYVSQAVNGFCMGLVTPLLMGLSIKSFPDEKRATAMGIFQALYGIGMFGGPVL